jgi:hypothetical protein
MSAERSAIRYTGLGAAARRVRAILRRHAYLIVKSPTRIISMMYYPTVTMIVWAFLTLYLAPTNNFLKDAPGFFIGAVPSVGRPVPRPARGLADVHRGVLCPQPRATCSSRR